MNDLAAIRERLAEAEARRSGPWNARYEQDVGALLDEVERLQSLVERARTHIRRYESIDGYHFGRHAAARAFLAELGEQ